MLQAKPGSYVLIIEVSSDISIEVGSLGKHMFPRGLYAYVGSAMGPGGLLKRICRHLSDEKKLRWHIDYLLANPNTKVVLVLAKECEERMEETLVRLVWQFGEPFIKGFGSSDTGLFSHLVRIRDLNALIRTLRTLGFQEIRSSEILCKQRD